MDQFILVHPMSGRFERVHDLVIDVQYDEDSCGNSADDSQDKILCVSSQYRLQLYH
jgi:hypothetical protein